MMNSDNGLVREKTIELCQTILDQPEFQNLRRHIDAFMEDDGIQTQYRELSEWGATLQHKQQMGLAVDPEEIAGFEQKREVFLSSPIARGFLEAQQAMHQVRDTVNRYVARTFELGRMPQPEDFQSCSCSGGCGQ